MRFAQEIGQIYNKIEQKIFLTLKGLELCSLLEVSSVTLRDAERIPQEMRYL